MIHKQHYLTPAGVEKLRAELEHLQTGKRAEVRDRIHAAQERGHTGDNADYLDAKNQQAVVGGRIRDLEEMLRDAVVIQEHPKSGIVRLGSTVTAETAQGDRDTYMIVGSAEANPRQGRISNESPVGRAFLGRKVGDAVQVMTPSGVLTYTIVAID